MFVWIVFDECMNFWGVYLNEIAGHGAAETLEKTHPGKTFIACKHYAEG